MSVVDDILRIQQKNLRTGRAGHLVVPHVEKVCSFGSVWGVRRRRENAKKERSALNVKLIITDIHVKWERTQIQRLPRNWLKPLNFGQI